MSLKRIGFAIALVVLAIGSVVAGYVGVPNVVAEGANRIEAFLEPSFHAAGEGSAATGAIEATAAESHGHAAVEFGLMGLSTIVAFAGIGLATLLFLRRPELADQLC